MTARKPVPPPSIAERKTRLASDLLDDAQKLRAQLFAPVVEHKVSVVPQGKGESSIEITHVELDQPTFADKRMLVASIGEIVVRVQELTGKEAGPDVKIEDWTAPVGTTSIRSASGRGKADVRKRSS